MSKRLEKGLAAPGRAVRISTPKTAEIKMLRQIIARVDPLALGASLAVVCGSILLLATNVLVLKGGQEVGSHLGLLSPG